MLAFCRLVPRSLAAFRYPMIRVSLRSASLRSAASTIVAKRLAPRRLACCRVARRRVDPSRVALLGSAPIAVASVRSTAKSLAPERFALSSLAFVRLAWRKSNPLRSSRLRSRPERSGIDPVVLERRSWTASRVSAPGAAAGGFCAARGKVTARNAQAERPRIRGYMVGSGRCPLAVLLHGRSSYADFSVRSPLQIKVDPLDLVHFQAQRAPGRHPLVR